MEGTIPTEVGNLKKMVALHSSHNTLSGTRHCGFSEPIIPDIFRLTLEDVITASFVSCRNDPYRVWFITF